MNQGAKIEKSLMAKDKCRKDFFLMKQLDIKRK